MAARARTRPAGDDWSAAARRKAGDVDPAPEPDDGGQDDGQGSGGRRERARAAATKGGKKARNVAGKVGKSAPIQRGGTAAVHGGSIVVGLMGYALVINYLRYGSAGVKAWLKAKLVNKPVQSGYGIPVLPATLKTGAPASDAPAPSRGGGTNFA